MFGMYEGGLPQRQLVRVNDTKGIQGKLGT